MQLYALAPYALSHLIISLFQTRCVKCIIKKVLYREILRVASIIIKHYGFENISNDFEPYLTR